MELDETTQTPEPTQVEGGITPEPSAPSSEPSAPSAEPSAPSEPAAPTPEELANAKTEPPPVRTPKAEEWGWDNWDGKTLDAFPEATRPWMERALGHFTPRMTDLQRQVNHYKSLYEYETGSRPEDPRVAQYQTEAQQHQEALQALQAQHDAFQAEVEAERQAMVDQYFAWFDEHYGDKMQQAVAKYGTSDAAEEKVGGLMDLGFDAHVALEIALLGENIIQEASDLVPYVRDEQVLFEVLAARHPELKAHLLAGPGRNVPTQPVVAQPDPEPKPERPAPPPSASLVAGAEPQTRAADVNHPEQKPIYASGFEGRRNAINQAALNAIKRHTRG